MKEELIYEEVVAKFATTTKHGAIKDKTVIENLIYEVRGKQVMLDSDLARLYETETKRINEAIYRNKEKFPERFCFRITEDEYRSLKSQFATSKGGSRKGHTVFTEQGVAMLATVLKTHIATKVSISIMDAFVAMRKYVSSNLIEQKYINDLVLEDHEKIKLLEKTFNRMDEKNHHLFFEGQIYDAYSLLIDIFNKAKKEIIILDNYIDKNLLDILSKTNMNVKIFTNKYNNIDCEKYRMQYNNVDIKISNNFHDRFIIIDKKILYHSGASFKDLGKKCFEISKIEDESILENLIKKLAQ